MSITITQKCDSCGTERNLRPWQGQDSEGWTEVKANRHMCNKCIDATVGAEPEPDPGPPNPLPPDVGVPLTGIQRS